MLVPRLRAITSGTPAPIAGKVEEPEDLAIDGGAEEELCELVLPLLIDAEVLDDLVREVEQVGAGDGFFELFDPLLYPFQVSTPERARGRIAGHRDRDAGLRQMGERR
jgi:hypothetical protein